MSPTPRPLVIKTTSGTERPEATNQAFTVAAAAVAAGAAVFVEESLAERAQALVY